MEKHVADLSNTKLLVKEYAVAITINNIDYAVMMLNPNDLEDFAFGFLFSERVIANTYDIHDLDISINSAELTAMVNVQIANRCLSKLQAAGRQIQGNSGCGICGVISLAQAMPKLTPLIRSKVPDSASVLALKQQLLSWQTQGQSSGAMHAAFLLQNNKIIACREDIGRHNALDKLIGCKLQMKVQPTGELAFLVTSRCSVELVHKAIIANVGTLISLASASQLAVNRARQANLNLIHIPKHDQPIYY
ncbi:hypothetical protein A9Q98_07205 [Thalassotalea sp. 42_200_T64]|nr:hypothetical protein A9Q98_07205 [Thalassotalea sp. 42_200_T64]